MTFSTRSARTLLPRVRQQQGQQQQQHDDDGKGEEPPHQHQQQHQQQLDTPPPPPPPLPATSSNSSSSSSSGSSNSVWPTTTVRSDAVVGVASLSTVQDAVQEEERHYNNKDSDNNSDKDKTPRSDPSILLHRCGGTSAQQQQQQQQQEATASTTARHRRHVRFANLPPLSQSSNKKNNKHHNENKNSSGKLEKARLPTFTNDKDDNHNTFTFTSNPSKKKKKNHHHHLEVLANVTELSRSLIPPSYFDNNKNKAKNNNNNNNMSSSLSTSGSTKATSLSSKGGSSGSGNTSSGSGGSGRGSLFKRMSGRRGRSEESSESGGEATTTTTTTTTMTMDPNETNNNNNTTVSSPKSPTRRAHSADTTTTTTTTAHVVLDNDEHSTASGRSSMFGRLRERSRSRSRSRKDADHHHHHHGGGEKEMLVAVTSCRSDGYYNQKAPGSTAKLPRKAPANLKLFHELAVGVKDAYAAVGETPKKPSESTTTTSTQDREWQGQMVLWEFVGNLDFLLALVDEVAVDSVTRGALKDDSTFKGLRDVIKKGNRVLEEMLVRRERKYTLFFRLVSPRDATQIERMQSWNLKVEKAVGAITDDRSTLLSGSEASSDTDSTSVASSTAGSSVSSRAGVFSRGRQLLPTAGRVRSRRATPTPRLRNRKGSDDNSHDSAADGFSAVTSDPLMSGSSSVSSVSSSDDSEGMLPSGLRDSMGATRLQGGQPAALQPKDELVDVIRGLRVEKMTQKEGQDEELAQLKPNWQPKADVPSSVPKLPIEYVHRHRLMKQVVSCLLGETEARAPDGTMQNAVITCVTSRHGDKAGNGKSTLAVAVIQTVEVRERFVDGIAWLKLGRNPLGDRDIRRLYEELYRQLVVKETDIDASVSEGGESMAMRGQDSMSSFSELGVDRTVERADSTRRFQGGDLEGIKEDLGRMLASRKVLICLDDVWRVDDAKWFIFESTFPSSRESPYKVLITTRVAALLGAGAVQEVFVRILSEHEAVKLLLSTSGRRPYGGRNSAVFHQSKLVVKGCGNSPLGILLVGSMLRNSNRNWSMSSPVWTGIFNQCSLNLEEAAQLRSFKNSLTRIVDASFFTVEDPYIRVALRRCFVLFAMAFRGNDWMLSGKGIPQAVCLKFFSTVVGAGPKGSKEEIDSEFILHTLEELKLMTRAGHRVSPQTAREVDKDNSESSDRENGDSERDDWDDFDEVVRRPVQQYYTMHDSLKAVAELMALRPLPCFTPEDDQFNYFGYCIEEESGMGSSGGVWTAPLRFLAGLSNPNQKSKTLTEEKVHEVVCVSLVGGGDNKALNKKSIAEAMKTNQLSMKNMDGGDKFEEYVTAFLPEHLMQSKAYSSAGELLTDQHFVRRRVFSLGIMEATSRQIADILDLRSYVGKGMSAKKMPSSPTRGQTEADEPVTDPNFDIDEAVGSASRVIIDEVYKVTNSMGVSDSLGMATCLATVGETLLKCRQPRDAMLRLEEAVSIYRGLLGPYHVYVAHALHSVAKALAKIGETRVALLKFAEAARIYEACNATLHFDSIANAQALASLLVDIGDVRKAESMFEEVISMKQAVYGDTSVQVAKTINSYAILLAKHGRVADAMRNYEIAKTTYERAPPPIIYDSEFEMKCSYDMTLITLNMASIYSKKGDLDKALQCYMDGVKGLEVYEGHLARLEEARGWVDASQKQSAHKHMMAALGRIGSLKLKLGDNDAALEAYMSLINTVEDDSPLASHVEKAKAHIKCATIFRQREGHENREHSVEHLREAHRMYEALYGAKHKDTIAIESSLKQWLAEDKK